MADTVISITDGTVTRTVTVPQATWDKVAESWVRDGTPLADTDAEFIYWREKVRKELQNLANKEITMPQGKRQPRLLLET